LTTITLLRTVVIGAINWDINLFIKAFPRKGEEVAVERITRVPGGKAGNVVVAAARLLGPKQTAILGGLGKDSIASEHVRIFEEEGVVVSGLMFNPNAESGQAYIVIDEEGANIIHTHFGANATVRPEDLGEPVRHALISEARVITIMDPLFETALKLAQDAKRMSKIVAWAPGLKSAIGIQKAATMLRNVDYLVTNEFEMEYLTGKSNPDEAVARLLEVNSKMRMITTLGAKGCSMYSEGERMTTQALDVKSLGLSVVNTVGCGDAFIGAFVAAISEGLSNAEALRWGCCAGGLKATRRETRGSPSREMLLKYLT